MNRTKRITTLAATAALTCVAGAQASFTSLGLLSGGAVPVSRAYGVSNNGTVVVGYSSSTIGRLTNGRSWSCHFESRPKSASSAATRPALN